jgi:hypothetical protein
MMRANKFMALVNHTTAQPVELAKEIVTLVAKNHREILDRFSKDDTRENTGNARSAVTKPSSIPPWSR